MQANLDSRRATWLKDRICTHWMKHLLFWQPLLRDEKGEGIVLVRLCRSVVWVEGGKRRRQSAGSPRRSVYPLPQSTFCLLAVPLPCPFPTHPLTQLLGWANLPMPHIFTTEVSRRQYCLLHNFAYSKHIYSVFLLVLTTLFYSFTLLLLLSYCLLLLLFSLIRIEEKFRQAPP